MVTTTTAFSKVTSVAGGEEGTIAKINSAVRTLQGVPVVGEFLTPVRAVTETLNGITSGDVIGETARGLVRTGVSAIPGADTVDAFVGGKLGNIVAEHVIGKPKEVTGTGGMPDLLVSSGGKPKTGQGQGNVG